MQEMGLEPTRYCYHRHLKPARLPIPPLLRTICILSHFDSDVNSILKNFYKKIFFCKNIVILYRNESSPLLPANVLKTYLIFAA